MPVKQYKPKKPRINPNTNNCKQTYKPDHVVKPTTLPSKHKPLNTPTTIQPTTKPPIPTTIKIATHRNMLTKTFKKETFQNKQAFPRQLSSDWNWNRLIEDDFPFPFDRIIPPNILNNIAVCPETVRQQIVSN